MKVEEALQRRAFSFPLHVAGCAQFKGKGIRVPADAIFNIEHERSGDEEEIEFQLKWRG